MPAAMHQTHIIEQAPEVVLRGGLFYVTDKLENGGVIVRVFRPSTFFKAAARLGDHSRALRESAAEIVQFPDLAEKLGAS